MGDAYAEIALLHGSPVQRRGNCDTFPNGKVYKGEYKKGKPFGNGQWTYSDGSTYTGKWVNGEFINPDNKQDTFQFRIATFLINIIVIVFMLSVIGFWLLKFLKVI